MTLSDLRELVRVTARQHGDTAASIARVTRESHRETVHRWLYRGDVSTWPDWVSVYLAYRGVEITVRHAVTPKSQPHQN